MLNKNLFLLRSTFELSKVSFGKSLGVSGQYVSMLESGANKSIGQTVAMQIERIYHVSIDWLVTGTVNENHSYELIAAMQASHITSEMLAKLLEVPVSFVNAIQEKTISPTVEFMKKAVEGMGFSYHGKLKDATDKSLKKHDFGGEKHPDLLRYRISILEQNVEDLEYALSEEKYKNERLEKENEDLKQRLVSKENHV